MKLRAVVALLLALGRLAAAQTVGTCNGFTNLNYPSLSDPAPPACVSANPNEACTFDPSTGNCDCCLDSGQPITVSAQLGAGIILFGTQLDISVMDFDADCAPFVTPVCLARPGGPRIAWVGDSTIATTCPGLTITTGIPDNTPLLSTATIPLTFTPTLVVPENTPTPPGLCQFSFQLRVIADPGDSIFQLIRYEVGVCDNGNLVSGGRQTSKIQVCPAVGPLVGYEIKDQGITIQTGDTMDVPTLGIFGASIPSTAKLTAKRLLTPAKPNDIFGDHLLGFIGFPQPLPNPKPVLQIVAPGLGTFTAQMGGRSFVLINAVKDLVSQPPAQPLTSVWACYGFSKSAKSKIAWEDQFGPDTGTTKATTRVCLPASLFGSTPPATTYLCTNNFPTLAHLFPKTVFVGSAWLSAQETLDSVDDYCVPAAVTVQ